MTTRTVYVTQETNFDFANAEAFGNVRFLTRLDMNNMRDSLHNGQVLREIKHGLRDYDPEWDWLVIAGSPYVSAAVFLWLGSKGFREIRVLRWDNRDRVYRPMYIQLQRALLNIGDRP